MTRPSESEAGTSEALLDRIDAYLDAVPRSRAGAEIVGPFALFVPMTGDFALYARPHRDQFSLPVAPSADDVRIVTARQAALSLPCALEWLGARTPALATAAAAAGLMVTARPLLVAGVPRPVAAPVGVVVRDACEDELGAARAVAMVGFSHGGTARGTAGTGEAATMLPHRGAEQRLRDRARAGITRTVVAVSPDGQILATGSHQPVDNVTEIVGVATLPVARRRGLGAAVTARLLADALDLGVKTVFLSAGDADVARIYERVGFHRVGTSYDAEPPDTEPH